MAEKMKVGMVGCGNISQAYFKGSKLYSNIEIVACADINREAAESRAKEFDCPRVLEVEELMNDEEVETVLNLTTPQFHAPINKQALLAGKHAYCEKPFATNRSEGLEVLELAKKSGLYVGCAPDTFLSDRLQTVRQLMEEGFIGKPFGAVAVFANPGHERWHPNPEFYYKNGGGPLLDMAPYYLTALANILGPIESVMASSKTTYPEREILSEPLKGQMIQVETDTHINGLLEFECGVTATTMFSFDMRGRHDFPRLEIFGSEGSLSLPDPNRFDGDVLVNRDINGEWENVVLKHNYQGERALGLAEMADAIQQKRNMRAKGELAYHVFDVMACYDESNTQGRRMKVESTFVSEPVMPSELAYSIG